MPKSENTLEVKPEQSKPLVVVPPYLYGTPKYLEAVSVKSALDAASAVLILVVENNINDAKIGNNHFLFILLLYPSQNFFAYT